LLPIISIALRLIGFHIFRIHWIHSSILFETAEADQHPIPYPAQPSGRLITCIFNSNAQHPQLQVHLPAQTQSLQRMTASN
jgi:hypothetical protein